MEISIEQIKAELETELSKIKEIHLPLRKYTAVVAVMQQVNKNLKAYSEAHSFENEEEEINFFKIEKPGIIYHMIVEDLRYKILINKPIGTSEIQQQYLEQQLDVLEGLFRLNAFHYQYYKNGFKELDRLYFLRNATPTLVPLPEIANPDAEFITPMTYLFAKFIAYEHLQYFILEELAILKDPNYSIFPVNQEQILELTWTGDLVNIVELAYGLWLTGQLNNGNASLNQIVQWLEANLHISIGIVQRRFTEISARKRISTTKFVDQMRDAIIKKMESDHK